MKKHYFMTLIMGALGCAPAIFAQSSAFKGLEHLFITPKSYVVGYTATPPIIMAISMIRFGKMLNGANLLRILKEILNQNLITIRK